MVQDNSSYCPDYIKSIKKTSIGKIYTVLNNYRFTSWYNIILVNISNLVKLVFTLQASSKSKKINCMGCDKGQAIKAAYRQSSVSNTQGLKGIAVI